MDILLLLTFLYLMLLLLALLVERIMELLHAVFNYVEWKFHFERIWNRRARRLLTRYDSKAKSNILSHALIITQLGRMVKQYTPSEEGVYPGNVIIISGKAVRQVLVSALSRVVATGVAFVLCAASGINLFTVIDLALGASAQTIPFYRAIDGQTLQLAITAVLIGLGSEPVHHVINNIERRRELNVEKERLNKALVEAAQKQV
ncbi:MAG: hypothetical protein R2834_16830 [Rhodothermales bacterium]